MNDSNVAVTLAAASVVTCLVGYGALQLTDAERSATQASVRLEEGRVSLDRIAVDTFEVDLTLPGKSTSGEPDRLEASAELDDGDSETIGDTTAPERLRIEVPGVLEFHHECVGEREGIHEATWSLELQPLEGDVVAVADGVLTSDEFDIELPEAEGGLFLTVTLGAGHSGYSPSIEVPRDAQGALEVGEILKKAVESRVVGMLRSVAASQQQLQASAAIDTDADGGGEHGYFAELMGAEPLRGFGGVGAGAVISPMKLDPPYLPPTLGDLRAGANGGILERDGYAFQMFLPGDEARRPISGIAEAPLGGNSFPLPGASNAEVMWCCYAWPLESHDPARRAFFINQDGDVLSTDNESGLRYVGSNGGPSFDAAFSALRDMGSQPGMHAAGLSANDGNEWDPVGI